MPTNVAAVQSAWTQAKADLSTFQTTLTTLISNLASLEADRDTLYSLGASDVADWLANQIRQARLGYQPRVSAGGGQPPQLVMVQAANPSIARDNTFADLRPVTSTATAQQCGLS
jgi:hypothetical protein